MRSVVELTGRVTLTAHSVVVTREGDGGGVTYLVDAVYDEAVLSIVSVYLPCGESGCSECALLPLCHVHPEVLAAIEVAMRAQVVLGWQDRATCLRCRQETGVPERHEIYCGQTDTPEMSW